MFCWSVDVKHLQFSWNLESNKRGVQQKKYQILAATSRNLLTNEEADIWNSQKISRWKSINITESGNQIWSNDKYTDGVKGISDGTQQGKYIMFNVASRNYKFELKKK